MRHQQNQSPCLLHTGHTDVPRVRFDEAKATELHTAVEGRPVTSFAIPRDDR